MESGFTTLTAWSYGLSCVGFAALALQLGLRFQGGLRGFVLLVAVILSALWGLLEWTLTLHPTTVLALAASISDVLRVGAWCTFLLLLIVWPGMKEAFLQVRWLIVTAAGLISLGILAHVLKALGWEPLGDPGRIALLDALALAVLVIVLVETLLRNFPADSRWNVKPVGIGLIAVFGFDIYVYADAILFNRIDAAALSVRGLVNALLIPLAAVTVARSGSWASRVTLSRRVVFHSAALVASGIYLLFVAGAGYYVRVFGGEWGRAFQVALSLAGIIGLSVLAFSASVRAKLRVLINKHFFTYRFDYREEWLHFTRTLSTCDGEAGFGQQVIRGLANMVESPSGALWLRAADAQHYLQSARWNMPIESSAEAADNSLPRFLRQRGWVINIEEYRSLPGRYGDFNLPKWLGGVPSAWLIVPLISGDDLIGFVVLGTPRTRVDADWEVNDLLKTAGRQAASFLGHMQANDALLEARKFDAFNRMSAFVVHDLKNIVAQLSLMLRNAERHKDNPEFQQDMLMTVGHTINRMKQLMMQLREGTTPMSPPGAVDLAEVIRRIQKVKQGQEPVPELNLEEQVIAKGHEDRVERVIGHIVQNAIDATDENGRVCVNLTREGGEAVIEVRDNGHGITREFLRERLFKPFQTTKPSGMGIGAYESYQYIHDLGGSIVVDSEPGVGTTMRILLPLYEKRTIPESGNKAAA